MKTLLKTEKQSLYKPQNLLLAANVDMLSFMTTSLHANLKPTSQTFTLPGILIKPRLI